MHIQRIAAFSDGLGGGNPAGVVLADAMPPEDEMRRIAREVGYSETAFAAPLAEDASSWRVRYFAPEAEVPFCGHATIALGAALAERHGPGRFDLQLNGARISVEGRVEAGRAGAVLRSPATRSEAADPSLLAAALELFGLEPPCLDERIPPARIHGGSDHLVLALREREALRSIAYELVDGRELMLAHGLVTIMLVWSQSHALFHARNAFASGGVLEDPATGAAAAAFAGHLRDLGWPHGGAFRIVQGEDMGSRSLIDVRLTSEPGAPVEVAGGTRRLVG